MEDPIVVEVIGLKDSSCSPFPCNATRSCGLYDCHPTGKLLPAFEALSAEIREEYGEKIQMKLTLIDDEVPRYIQDIIAEHYPPIPIILVNGELVPMGRISLPQLQKEIEKRL